MHSQSYNNDQVHSDESGVLAADAWRGVNASGDTGERDAGGGLIMAEQAAAWGPSDCRGRPWGIIKL